MAGVTTSPGGGPAMLLPGHRLAGRYTIIKLLGRGGMGAVFQAWDDELGVAVAIKTILPGPAADPDAEERERRFKREILLARQVSHRNVVRIHDIGEVGGAKYITMAFIEGETLAALIRRRGPLPVPDSLALVRQIAAGLAAAHDAGVVHRDLKPENVMVTPDGAAVVTDFGIASSAGGSTLTSTGAIVGTIEYMAPEQVKGEVVDARTDVYAFGLVIYDMLSGRRRAASSESPMSELLARATAAPPSLRSRGAPVPEPVDDLVMRCLQPLAAARFASGGAVLAALNDLTAEGWSRAAPPAPASVQSGPQRHRLWALAAVAALTAAVGAAWFRGASSTPEPPTRSVPGTVLVADVVNAVGAPTFDGLIEQALGVGLESSSFITAFPRRDALRAAAQLPRKVLDEDNARLVAIREGVHVVASGRLESDAGGYRLSVRALTAGPQARTLFEAAVVASGKAEVLPVVGQIAARLRRALGDSTVDAQVVRTDETFTAASLEAAKAYVQGQEFLGQGRQADAEAAYRRAVALDADFGRAWSGLGAVLTNLGRSDEARAAYERALSRLELMTEREKFRTRVAYYIVTRNAQKALEEAEALVERFPADAAGLANLANAHFQRRDFSTAAEIGGRAAAIFPSNVLRQNNVALFLLYAGRFAEAETQARRALTLNPDYPRAHLALAHAQTASGRIDEARTTYTALATVPGGRTFAAHGLADLALLHGRLDEAAEGLEAAISAESSAAPKARLALALAEVRAAQGETASALRAVEVSRAVADPAVKFEAGRLLVLLAQSAEAKRLAADLSSGLDPETQALGDVLAAEVALAAADPREALDRLNAARARADSWWLRYAQGRAFLAAGRFAEADSEFDLCHRRRGEALALFLDDIPTWRVTAPLLYYQGLAREGLSSPRARESFEAFVALKDGGDEAKGLVADARKRLAAP
jgi:eukaryotic-like serine/threonine-protein kinase